MPGYLALVEVDQRQNFILNADKLLEMLGASRIIEETVKIAERRLIPPVKLIWPVSGVLWLTSKELAAMTDTLRGIRLEFRDLGLSTTYAVCEYSASGFDSGLRDLQLRMRSRKNAKGGEDGKPRNPFFAQCSIQGALPANQWWPEGAQTRRRLISDDSATRLKQGEEYRRDSLPRDLKEQYKKRLEDFDDLKFSDSDSYISLCKADIDALGRLLLKMNWAVLGERLECSPEEAARKFAGAVEGIVKGALDLTIRGLVGEDQNKKTCLPILPLVVAGDDLWVLCRRDMAFPLTIRFARHFDEAAHQNDVLNQAIALFQPGDFLSLSFGVLFAKKGFPFDAQLELADELESGAKKYRKDLPQKAGCIDYHWLESSGRESIETARDTGYSVQDGSYFFRITTRPWTIEEAGRAVAAANRLLVIPRRKRHQLDTILRYGYKLSDLAYTRWLRDLGSDERNAFDGALAALPERLRPTDGGPWFLEDRTYKSCLAELAQMAEIIQLPKEGERQ